MLLLFIYKRFSLLTLFYFSTILKKTEIEVYLHKKTVIFKNNCKISFLIYNNLQMHKLKFVINTLFLLGLTVTCTAQKVFSVQNSNQADVRVFVVDYENQADLKVYKVKYQNQAGKNNGNWFFTEYSNQADKKLFFVKYQNQADLKIFFVQYENQAGWKNKTKQYLMY